VVTGGRGLPFRRRRLLFILLVDLQAGDHGRVSVEAFDGLAIVALPEMLPAAACGIGRHVWTGRSASTDFLTSFNHRKRNVFRVFLASYFILFWIVLENVSNCKVDLLQQHFFFNTQMAGTLEIKLVLFCPLHGEQSDIKSV
jgi:hypothetical protein